MHTLAMLHHGPDALMIVGLLFASLFLLVLGCRIGGDR